MLRHIFVIQKFSSFVKLLDHSVELFFTVSQGNDKSKVFYFLEKSVATLPFLYILKVLDLPERAIESYC